MAFQAFSRDDPDRGEVSPDGLVGTYSVRRKRKKERRSLRVMDSISGSWRKFVRRLIAQV